MLRNLLAYLIIAAFCVGVPVGAYKYGRAAQLADLDTRARLACFYETDKRQPSPACAAARRDLADWRTRHGE